MKAILSNYYHAKQLGPFFAKNQTVYLPVNACCTLWQAYFIYSDMYRKIGLLALVAILNTATVFSQRSLELGLGMGISLYAGDITENYIQYNGHKRVYSAFFRYNLNPHISVKGTYTKGVMGASDFYSETRFDRGWSFSAQVDEAVVTGQIFLLNQFLTTRKGESVFLFSPYILLGLGYSKIDASFVNRFNPDMATTNAENSDLFLVVPFGGGVRGELSPSFKLGIEIGVRPTFSDFVDDINTSTEANDWYTFAGVNLSYVVFREKYKAYKQRRFRF